MKVRALPNAGPATDERGSGAEGKHREGHRTDQKSWETNIAVGPTPVSVRPINLREENKALKGREEVGVGNEEGTGTEREEILKEKAKAVGYDKDKGTRGIGRARGRREGGYGKRTGQEQEGEARGIGAGRSRIRSTELGKRGSDGGQAASSNKRGVRGEGAVRRGCTARRSYTTRPGGSTATGPRKENGRLWAATGPHTSW